MNRIALISLPILAAACFATTAANAADLGGYEERETYVERPAPVIERERVIVEHHYYEPRVYVEEPVVTYYDGPRYYRPYYAGHYPYRFAGFHRDHWRGHRRW
jgi:hypothetical protein